MPHVSVTIAGRSYRMACDDGQEEHLLGLGRTLDAKIDTLRAAFGEIGDMRLAVMAGIMVADELAEANRRIRALERDLEGQRDARSAAQLRSEDVERQVASAIGEAAVRLERMAEALSRRS
jgi:cell division protein ZapA